MNRIVLPEFHEAEVVRAEKIDAAVQTILEHLNGSLDVQALAAATQFALADLLEPYSLVTLDAANLYTQTPGDAYSSERAVFPAIPAGGGKILAFSASCTNRAPFPAATSAILKVVGGANLATLPLTVGRTTVRPFDSLTVRLDVGSLAFAAPVAVAGGAQLEATVPVGVYTTEAVFARILLAVPHVA